jgi:hypothetical protein
MAKWKLPAGGSLLNQDMLWETRVRYVTPPYFWTAIWAAGNKWSRGAEVDVMESFGYDNGGGITNYDGRYWHSNSVGGNDAVKYANWGRDMAAHGFGTFDATQYHTWSWLYRRDNTFTVYLDGVEVQSGAINWTLRAKAAGEPLEMYFLFDGAWGHTGISSVNKPLAAAELDGKYYEWNYSRVYLRKPAPDAPPVGPVPDPVKPAEAVPAAANVAPNADPNAAHERTFQVSGKWENPTLLTDLSAAAKLKAHPLLKLDLTVPPEPDSSWLQVKLVIECEGLKWAESPKWLLNRAPGTTGITKETLAWDTTGVVAKMPDKPNWFKIDLVTQGGRARTLYVDNVRYEDVPVAN